MAQSKLTQEQWEKIVVLHQQGKSYRDIAALFGVQHNSIAVGLKRLENTVRTAQVNSDARIDKAQKELKKLEDIKSNLTVDVDIDPEIAKDIKATADKLTGIIKMEKAVDSFINNAIALSSKNLMEISKEIELANRIIGIEKICATVVKIAMLSNSRPKFRDEGSVGNTARVLEIKLVH